LSWSSSKQADPAGREGRGVRRHILAPDLLEGLDDMSAAK
jgi:hypothetical protein